MGAYNRFRGQYCCHNAHLLQRVLKDEWGFAGVVVSDWAGTHDTREAVLNGLDIEMGGGSDYPNLHLARPYRDGLHAGVFPMDGLDDKVRRNLRVRAAIGALSASDPERPTGAVNIPVHQTAARQIAREGLVLLRNEGALLPLRADRIRKLLVVGQNATLKHSGGGGSSSVTPRYEVTPLEALRERYGDCMEIQYLRGYPADLKGFTAIPEAFLGADASGIRGWTGRYFANLRHEGKPEFVRRDPTVDFEWKQSPVTSGLHGFSVIWETTVKVAESDEYILALRGCDHTALSIDGQAFLSIWGNSESLTVTKELRLEAGREYVFRILFNAKPSEHAPVVRLEWVRASERPVIQPAASDAVEAAKRADAVLFFGGLDHQIDREGRDRADLDLRYGQNELIAALAQANPRTVVVTYGGGAFRMPWLDRVRALLHVWYPGMEGGRAVMDVLFGDVNPSGKLPVSFFKQLGDCAAHRIGDYRPDTCVYRDGLFVGYRHLDREGIAPLFCFGHGLSYTTFAYDGLEMSADDRTLLVRFGLGNTGGVAGAEVAQVYVSVPDSRVERPVRELKGFAKVWLQPGERRLVEVSIAMRHLAYYDVEQRRWRFEPGSYGVQVGSSSRDLRLQGVLSMEALRQLDSNQ
jgi:beta-glucosidase